MIKKLHKLLYKLYDFKKHPYRSFFLSLPALSLFPFVFLYIIAFFIAIFLIDIHEKIVNLKFCMRHTPEVEKEFNKELRNYQQEFKRLIDSKKWDSVTETISDVDISIIIKIMNAETYKDVNCTVMRNAQYTLENVREKVDYEREFMNKPYTIKINGVEDMDGTSEYIISSDKPIPLLIINELKSDYIGISRLDFICKLNGLSYETVKFDN